MKVLVHSLCRHSYDSFHLELTANRSTQFLPRPLPPSGRGEDLPHYRPRQCAEISSLGSRDVLPYGEFDTVGVVAHVHTTSCDLEGAEQGADLACLADQDHGILVMRAWGGLKVSPVDRCLSTKDISSMCLHALE